MRSSTITLPAAALALSLMLTTTLVAATPIPLPPLRNLPRAPPGRIDYTRDMLDPILCPETGADGACAAQCALLSSPSPATPAGRPAGVCDANGNCICADGEGPIRRQQLREQH